MTFNPWRALRRLSHITLAWERDDERLGWWDQHDQTVTLHPDQSQRQRRCTLAHELIHAERGDVECDDRSDSRYVHAEAARRLISLDALAQALAWTNDLEELAEELWVDPPTLRARLDHLHPSERGLLRRRLATREHTA